LIAELGRYTYIELPVTYRIDGIQIGLADQLIRQIQRNLMEL